MCIENSFIQTWKRSILKPFLGQYQQEISHRERLESCLIASLTKFLILTRLGNRPLTQIPIDMYFYIFALKPFQNALTYPNRLINTLVIKEKVYFSKRGFRSRSRSWTTWLRIQNSRPYYWCLHRASCEISSRRTDRRLNDFSWALFF
jgi:hypothetical protein